MIFPPGYPGIAFTTAGDGDMRGDQVDRDKAAAYLGIPQLWAVVDQVHGSTVVRATAAVNYGPADALFTTEADLPLAIFTADCLGVALIADGAVGVAHAGWRGVVAGVVPNLVEAMTDAGFPPLRAGIGPGINSCCYEVGADVAEQLPGFVSETTWGTVSVDLPRAVRGQLGALEIWEAGECTKCSAPFHSHRVNATPARMATIAWIT